MQITYDELLKQAERRLAAERSYYYGVLMAKTHLSKSPPPWSPDEYQQQHFIQGYEDGKVVLDIEQLTKEAT